MITTARNTVVYSSRLVFRIYLSILYINHKNHKLPLLCLAVKIIPYDWCPNCTVDINKLGKSTTDYSWYYLNCLKKCIRTQLSVSSVKLVILTRIKYCTVLFLCILKQDTSLTHYFQKLNPLNVFNIKIYSINIGVHSLDFEEATFDSRLSTSILF